MKLDHSKIFRSGSLAFNSCILRLFFNARSLNSVLAYWSVKDMPIRHCPAELLNFLAVFKNITSFF